MITLNALQVKELTTEHLTDALGIDTKTPRFCWKLAGDGENIMQTAYRLVLTSADSGKAFGNSCSSGEAAADTGIVSSDQSIEVTIPGFLPQPMTSYTIHLTVWDNRGRSASCTGSYETGRMGIPFSGRWIEPVQEPTPSTMDGDRDGDTIAATDGPRDFHEFRPAQYIRIPFTCEKPVKSARIYATAHGIYHLEMNGIEPDDRELAPENTAYNKLMYYQTYDVTSLLLPGKNVIGVALGDGWWTGRVGTTGDCCQYGDTIGLLLNAELEYWDGSHQTITGEDGISSTGPILFSDLFVGEKYDARREMPGWSLPSFDDSSWLSVLPRDYKKDHLTGQFHAPITTISTFTPAAIITTPKGETVLDCGQVVAGNIHFELITEAGHEITLEHSEVLDEKGNFYNNILNVNKEQTVWYTTKDGWQEFRPHFSYHGFRYVKITGWPGRPSVDQFRVHVFGSLMEEIGSMTTSDSRINQLLSNIRWSQRANTISIPTDCPQREKAGWTGDIMAFAPTLCFNSEADAFLSSWMANVRAEQMSQGEIPMIVPYLPAYATFLRGNLGADTSCGWGDAVLRVPLSVYQAYGDKQILADNYEAMKKWVSYIEDRAANNHPAEYESYTGLQKEHDKYLWTTDFHFGDWLVPSMVLGNSDAMAMNNTAYRTMRYVAPAYFGFSALLMRQIAEILGHSDDAAYYGTLYEKIKEAYIAEYVREDGSLPVELQGVYVITLQMGLVPDEIRPKMVQHLCDMIAANGDKLDTGFLSVIFLMDVLCDNGRSDMAYKILYQTGCPSWLYEVLHGGTTMWESWGATGEDGSVSTYSYNHYAFGCVEDWMVRHIGGLSALEAGYKKIRIAPHTDCGLTSCAVSENTPYGIVSVKWDIIDGITGTAGRGAADDAAGHAAGSYTVYEITIPANTTAEIELPGNDTCSGAGSGVGDGADKFTIGSGTYRYIC